VAWSAAKRYLCLQFMYSRSEIFEMSLWRKWSTQWRNENCNVRETSAVELIMHTTEINSISAIEEEFVRPQLQFHGILELHSIFFAINETPIIRGVSLHANPAQITGIIGPNGAGKSTLLNIIGGLLKPKSGQVLLEGSDISALPMRARTKRGLVRTFQFSRELGELTVLENMLTAGMSSKSEFISSALFWRRRTRLEQAQAANEARLLLEKVGLWPLADFPAKTLSGGQKKLLELARALMLDPKVILLDEPAAGVSPPLRLEISRIISELREEGRAILIVEHDMDVIARLCDHVYVIAEGQNLAKGSFREVVSDKRVIEAYLGGVV
jgi:ABC-type branched-subunit amino acid transport system ATPase component